jgi:hypothetical protein
MAAIIGCRIFSSLNDPLSCSEQEIVAKFPLEPVRRGGTNTWAYVIEAVRQLMDPSDGHIFLRNSIPVDATSAPFPVPFTIYHPVSLISQIVTTLSP